MMRGVLAAVLCLIGCHTEPSIPSADMTIADASTTSDASCVALDLAGKCLMCNALINPCPPLGLFCDPNSGCCDSKPH